MKKMVTPPKAISYLQRYKDVVSAKKDSVDGKDNQTKQNLLNIETKIINQYKLFEAAIEHNDLFNFKSDPTLNIYKEDLLSCYTGRTIKVKNIFKLIEDVQPQRFLKRCPYCGVTIPKTYDHYLPETDFPELSVHALNLIPCCTTCNQTKNKYWKNAKNRIVLHFYTDEIPEIEYIKVILYSTKKAGSVGATFSIHKPPKIKNSVWEILSAHYEKLGLISMYNELANDEISELFNVCVSHLQCDGTDIPKFINKLLIQDEQLYGLNHWRVVLMKALAKSHNFTCAVQAAI